MQDNKLFWARSRFNGKMVHVRSDDTSHDLSIVFFDADVTSRYRSRPSKYHIAEGYIKSNDEGWILQSYYVSTDNKVYCYLCDLSLLPEKEQKYWQLYNLQSPEGKEDSLAIARDLLCSFENFPKEELMCVLQKLESITIKIEKEDVQIWKPKENLKQMVNEILRPLVEEYKQYRDDFLLPLTRLIVDGFIEKNIREWLRLLNGASDEEERSLAMLRKCIGIIIDSKEKAKEIIVPLKDLHDEKSARASHGGKAVGQEMVLRSQKILDDIIISCAAIVKIIRIYNQEMESNLCCQTNNISQENIK